MKITNCRLCNSIKLKEWLDLGFHPHSDQFRKSKDEIEIRYPLRVLWCEDCGLSQLSFVVEKEVMFTQDYLYEASITSTASKHWEEFVEDVIKTTGIASGLSIDIGGNDGTLAEKFKNKGFDAINIDPCKEVADLSAQKVTTINEFFGDFAINKMKRVCEHKPNEIWVHEFQDDFGDLRKADIITGTNVFAHVHDLNEFMTNVLRLMHDNSVFVFESPYFGDFLRGVEYDTIYHQHLSYLSLKPLVPFLEKFGLEIFDVRFTPLHGGSFRCFIAKRGTREISPFAEAKIATENFTFDYLEDFAYRTKQHKKDLMTLLWNIKHDGKSIACVSSPAKGMTLMNYCGIDSGLIDFVTEKSKLKQGRYTPGSHILIESDEKLLERQPDYALLLAWNFKNEIIKNNPQFRGKWIIPSNPIEII